MCGRFALRRADKLKLDRIPRFDLERSVPRYNIAPTQNVWVVKESKTDRELTQFQWGLIPSWSERPAGIINARAESIEDKPSFKESFLRRRCLIPADGFYEWEKLGKATQPHFFQLKNHDSFFFAGIWDQWRQADSKINSCAIVTTVANELLAKIHHRMPVILGSEEAEVWLNENADISDIRALLTPFQSNQMTGFPVSSRVNNADIDDPDLVGEIEHGSDLTQRLLF